MHFYYNEVINTDGEQLQKKNGTNKNMLIAFALAIIKWFSFPLAFWIVGSFIVISSYVDEVELRYQNQ